MKKNRKTYKILQITEKFSTNELQLGIGIKSEVVSVSRPELNSIPDQGTEIFWPEHNVKNIWNRIKIRI